MYKKISRFFIDYEKEEQWLNNMSEKGYHFKSFNLFFYLFEVNKEESYTYRIELLPKDHGNQDYLSFMEDTGVEHVDSYLKWIYLRKPKSLGTFENYTDNRTKLELLNRIFYFQLAVTLFSFIVFIVELGLLLHGFHLLILLSCSFIAVLTLGVATVSLRNWRRIRKLKEDIELHD